MHQKKVKKYYRIRADYLWGIIICVIAITAAFFHLTFNHRQTKETSIPEKQIEQTDVTFDNLHSVLKNREDCYLCGNAEESLMEYYRKFDTIGLISLNDWYIIDFPLKNYDENGMEIQTNTSTSFLSGTTEEIRYSADGTPSRGMADIDVTLPENYRLNTDMLKKHLCPNCLKKVTDSLEYSKEANECIDAIPLCIVDFKTLEVYSLQKQWKSYFVRDYYVEVGSEDNSVKIEAFYLPELSD